MVVMMMTGGDLFASKDAPFLELTSGRLTNENLLSPAARQPHFHVYRQSILCRTNCLVFVLDLESCWR